MNYQLKHQDDINWFDLFKLEHPDHALGIINQLNGRHYQGVAPETLISGISEAYNGHINPQQVEQDLHNGRYYLVAFGECHAPLLKKVVRINDQQESPEQAQWEFTSNTFGETLSSSLRFLISNVPKPIFVAAAIRQEAKPESSNSEPEQKEANKEKEPKKFWIKVQSLYDDKWDTPLPLTVDILVDGAIIESGIQLHTGEGKSTRSSNLKKAQQTNGEPGTILLEDIPHGEVEVRVARVTGEEQSIASLKKDLTSSLESGYRDLVTGMKPFREQWDEYGYLSLAMSKMDGAFSAGEEWLDNQAELFDGDTWEQFGRSLSDGLSDSLDFTASYIPEAYDAITNTINDTLDDIDENSENLTSWNWWHSQVKDTVDKGIRKVHSEIEDAGEFLDDSIDLVGKLYKHKNSILNLPKQVAKGDATSVQNFVDTVLKDLDPELSKQIKESPDFHIVLELIADHDAALTYFSYMDMFLEAVPPNFYAYISGKAGVYVLLEIVLFIVLSFLTLGVGTAARLTALAAKMTTTSVRIKSKLDKAEKAQEAVKAMIEKFSDNAETLKKLGEKLVITRSVGRNKFGYENSTLPSKKKLEQREKKCRFCGGDHDAPKSLNGWVEYR